MNFENVKHKFGTWAPYFRNFIENRDMSSIFKKLKFDAGRGKIICPASNDIFRVFRETPYNDLRCIFILQDPYPWKVRQGDKMIYVADGLAMSCANTDVCQPSLRYFYEGMEKELCGGMNLDFIQEPNLEYLARQGVLLLNVSLTVELNKPGSHLDIWRPFIQYFFEEVINVYHRGIPIVFFGKSAAKYSKYVAPFLHWVREVIHPAAAAHKGTKWDSEGIFTWVNTILEQNNGPEFKIQWFKQLNEQYHGTETECTTN